MNKIFKAIASISGVAVLGLILGSCSSNPDSAGLEYMPDMYRSPAIEPYVDYGEVKGSLDISKTLKISALVPPMRTIPYYGTNEEEVLMMLPYHRLPNAAFAKTHGYFGWDFTANNEMDYEYLQAAADVNPYKITAANAEKMFEKGKELYTSNCLHCHGEKGDGNGPMVTAGSYVGVPNYMDRIALGDGQIFYSIYYGKGAMGGHASLVSKNEIWTLVHYIRKFQNPAYGTFDEKGLPMSATAAVVADTTVKM
jgi:mono/diheme cytochrome c family protein